MRRREGQRERLSWIGPVALGQIRPLAPVNTSQTPSYMYVQEREEMGGGGGVGINGALHVYVCTHIR